MVLPVAPLAFRSRKMCCISVGDLRAVHLHFNISILPCKWHYDRTATACSSFHWRYDGDKNLSVAAAHALAYSSSPFENPTNQIPFTTVLISKRKRQQIFIDAVPWHLHSAKGKKALHNDALWRRNDTREPCSLFPSILIRPSFWRYSSFLFALC